MNDMRWHGGGLSSVSHDATMTGTGTPSSPLSVVGGGFTVLKAAETPDGTITVFTFTSVPKCVISDGLVRFETLDYTLAGKVITFINDAPPVQSCYCFA